MYYGSQTGPITKKEERKNRDKNQLRSPAKALPSCSFAASLRSSSAVVASVTAGTEGHMGFAKNSEGNRLEELGMPSRSSG